MKSGLSFEQALVRRGLLFRTRWRTFTHSPALTVEALQRRDDDGESDSQFGVCVLAGQLDGGLVGLRARVAEEHLVCARVGRDPLGQLACGLRVAFG